MPNKIKPSDLTSYFGTPPDILEEFRKQLARDIIYILEQNMLTGGLIEGVAIQDIKDEYNIKE